MFAEITRILNHLLNLTTYALDCGAITPAFPGFEQREHLLEFYEAVGGSHYHVNYFRPGGVAKDVPPEIEERIAAWCRQFPAYVEELEALLTENRIFKQRTVDIGIMTPEQAMEWGFSGPNLRASGCAWDLRKAQPYEIYSELDFDIPVGRHGDCYDRYLVRVQEMRQSLRLIEQCLDAAGAGTGAHPGPQDLAAAAPRDEALHGGADPPLQALHRGLPRPAGATYTVTEAPKGEFGMYLVADGTNRPYRCKIRAPGFPHLQAMDGALQGAHAGRRRRHHRLARRRLRGDRPLSGAGGVRRRAPERRRPASRAGRASAARRSAAASRRRTRRAARTKRRTSPSTSTSTRRARRRWPRSSSAIRRASRRAR